MLRANHEVQRSASRGSRCPQASETCVSRSVLVSERLHAGGLVTNREHIGGDKVHLLHNSECGVLLRYQQGGHNFKGLRGERVKLVCW